MSDLPVLAIGETPPDFTLPDARGGDPFSLGGMVGQVVVLMWWSMECPWCTHYDDYIKKNAQRWAERGAALVLIGSNVNETPADLAAKADLLGLERPLLYDRESRVADLYGAITTPHLFVIGKSGALIYRGAIDNRSFRQKQATANFLEPAIEAGLAGRRPEVDTSPPYGCAIVRAIA